MKKLHINFAKFSWLILHLLFFSFIIFSCKTDINLVNSAKEFVIVKNKICYPPIIISPQATPELIKASNSLADYIFKISGGRPKIITELNINNIPTTAIWVGFSPNLSKLFPNLNFSFANDEEILISATSKNLIIIGKDVIHNTSSGPLQLQYGTCNAVYTFIQNFLGVRWLWPGNLGEEYKKNSNIAFSPFVYRFNPTIKARSGLFNKFVAKHRRSNDATLIWSKRQRLELSSLHFFSNHGFSDWWEKYHISNPEYFALQPNGLRELIDIPHRVKLCQSNPKVWDQWMLEVETQLEKNPYQTIFNASPNDGYNKGHCTCNNCKAWDSKPMISENYVTTERHVRFANKLAELLETKYPNKGYFVQLHAYGLSVSPPKRIAPRKNVIISCVTNFHLRGDGIGDYRTLHKKYFSTWASLTAPILWRPNLSNPVGQSWGLTDVAMHQAAEDLKFVSSKQCIGLQFDTYWGHWGNQAPQYYVLAQLAWNPSLDVDSVLNDFYKSAYGVAWKEMKLYWTLMETSRNKYIKSNTSKYRVYDIPDLYTRKWFNEAFKLLVNAEMKLSKNKSSKFYKRILFAKNGLEYMQLVVKIRRTMRDEYEPNPTTVNRKKVLALWNEMYDLKKRLPKFCINSYGVFHKTNNKRMMGLHPDNPINRRVKWLQKQDEGLE